MHRKNVRIVAFFFLIFFSKLVMLLNLNVYILILI